MAVFGLAFIFDSTGVGEWLVLLAVILIVVGPSRLPSTARKMGQVLSNLRRTADEFKNQIMTMDQPQPPPPPTDSEYVDIPHEDAAGHGDMADAAAGPDPTDVPPDADVPPQDRAAPDVTDAAPAPASAAPKPDKEGKPDETPPPALRS